MTLGFQEVEEQAIMRREQMYLLNVEVGTLTQTQELELHSVGTFGLVELYE
jgi:hypothetical protein